MYATSPSGNVRACVEMHALDCKYARAAVLSISAVSSVYTNNVSYLSPHAKLPSPSMENRNVKVRIKRNEFMSVNVLNESMDGACMAEI